MYSLNGAKTCQWKEGVCPSWRGNLLPLPGGTTLPKMD